ncbi:MAG: leucyl aminopeptidase [Chloroflexota bacterium]|nr:leucyl aminopeptidase [Chloroflexota bacterium]
MDVKVIATDIAKLEVDALMVNLFEGVAQPGGATGVIDKALGGTISQLIADKETSGKFKELTLIHTTERIPAKRIVVVGLGKSEELTLDRIRQAVAEACRFLRSKQINRVATIAHGSGAGGITPHMSAQAIVEGCILGLYSFRRHITKLPETGQIEELLVVERDKNKITALESGCRKGRILAEAACFARDMVNEPANCMTPQNMADIAQATAEELGLECTVLERDQMVEMGMGGLLGVARGSQEPPKFIILNYRGGDSSSTTIGLLGKGLTFDSGGISIKPSANMDEMKGDMAGGATVLSALRAIAQLKLKANVTVLIPATENLPSGSALKPGDVLTAMSGKTMEVANTDAEGRLILADALGYARKLELAPLIDVATLTGACRIALGDICTGLFSNNQELADKVLSAAGSAGEYVWQMPMYKDYKDQNKSEVADVKNTGGRYAGAITAAQFLAEFAEDTPWVHLDIAGTSWSDKKSGYVIKGATGAVVRTLVSFVEESAAESIS